jgi:hypothetical protein
MEFMIPIVLGTSFFAMIAWIVFVVVDGGRQRERLKVFTEFHARLIDRMGSAKDFGDFLQTDGGKRFLESLTVEKGHPGTRILRAVQVGIVLLLLGVGFFAANSFARFDTEGGFAILGLLLMFGGLGFLLAALASLVIARKLGMLQRPALDFRSQA